MKHEVTSLQTKKMLSAELKALMEKKTLSKITISEIVTNCGVNRKTFYYHFTDIQELLKWTLEQEAVEIVKKFDLILDSEEVIQFVLQYVEENKHILNCAYDSIGRDELKRFFERDFSEIIMKLIENVDKMLEANNEDSYKLFLCDFYTGAVANKLIDIFRSRGQYDKDTFIKYATVTLKNGLTAALEHRYE